MAKKTNSPFARTLIESKITLVQYNTLYCIAVGMNDRQTAAHLGVTERTVKNTLYALRKRLGTPTTMGAVLKLIKTGEMKLDDL